MGRADDLVNGGRWIGRRWNDGTGELCLERTHHTQARCPLIRHEARNDRSTDR